MFGRRKKEVIKDVLDDNPKSHSVPVILSRLIGESRTSGEDNGDDEGDGDDDGVESVEDEMDGSDTDRSDASSNFLLLLIPIPTLSSPLSLPTLLVTITSLSWPPALTSLVVM